MKRIMTKEALKNSGKYFARQDGSREFISLLACICADGSWLPPSLIYQGESHDLQDSWVDELGSETAYFAASDNGWSCNKLGLDWLQKVFEPHTKSKAGSHGRRILIVDGHSSHVNMGFLEWAHEHRIIVHIMPPHSTHKLQPLDVGLFSPLATAYQKQLNNLMHSSLGYVSMSKRLFYPMFRDAWNEAFNETNVLKAFAKTGIWPQDPSKVLDTIRKPLPATPTKLCSGQIKTPQTAKAIRRAHQAYRRDREEPVLCKIMEANIKLSAQVSIQKHIINGLTGALKLEKKKRQRGKALNLVGEADNGPQFYGPEEIARAQQFQGEKAAAEQADRDRIEANKAQALANKVRKEAEKAERALQAVARRQHAEEEQARKAAEKAAKQAEKQAIRAARKAAIDAKRASKGLPKLRNHIPCNAPSPAPDNSPGFGSGCSWVVKKATRTRAIVRPLRFQ